MRTGSTILQWGMASGAALVMTAATAQVGPWTSDLGSAQSAPRTGLGLAPAKTQVAIGCGASLLPCRSFSAATAPSSLRWSVELSTLNLASRTAASPPGRQGLNLSLVGSRPILGSHFAVYGRVGATYGLADAQGTSALAANDASPGMSFGAGLSMEVTPRLSATLGWDSHEMRLGNGPRDTMRSTSLGLQYRY